MPLGGGKVQENCREYARQARERKLYRRPWGGPMVMGVGMDQIAGSAAPTSAAERIFALDVIRGFAVLGILLMNILGFGLSGGAYMYPIDIAGGNTGPNL